MHLLVISNNEQILFSPQKFALCWQDSSISACCRSCYQAVRGVKYVVMTRYSLPLLTFRHHASHT